MTGKESNDLPPLPPALLRALRTPPPRLDVTTAQRLREGVLERIVEAAEASPFGQAVAAAMAAPAESKGTAEAASLAESAAVGELGATLTDRLRSVPSGAPTWLQVRAAVLAPAPARRAARALLWVGAGVAAAAVAVLLLQPEPRPAAPEIVFADIQALPASGFSPMAVLRHGGGR